MFIAKNKAFWAPLGAPCLQHHMALRWSAQFSCFEAINMWPRRGQNLS